MNRYISQKPDVEDIRGSVEGYTIPKCNRFTHYGLWTLHYFSGQYIQGTIEDIDNIPGTHITHQLHQYGWKYNDLYNEWRCYNFQLDEYI